MTTKMIRRAAVEDAPALTQILNDAIGHKLSHGDSAWGKTGWTEMGVWQSLSRSEVYVIEQDDMPVATMSLSWQDETYWGAQDPIAGYVHRIAVRNGFHGLGLGRSSIDWCANQVSAMNRGYLRLDFDQRNTKLCAYYEALGFTWVATKPMPELGEYVASFIREIGALDLGARRGQKRPLTGHERGVPANFYRRTLDYENAQDHFNTTW
jgi:ribosomal protein S18 acetylase RimI-like enzyme